MWALNKNDWPWLLMGFIGAIMAGGTFPSEGVFIAHVQARLFSNPRPPITPPPRSPFPAHHVNAYLNISLRKYVRKETYFHIRRCALSP